MNRSGGPKWLRGAGTIGAAAAAGLVAYFGVRMLMGPAAADPSSVEETPAAAAEAPQEEGSSEAPEAPADSAPEPKKKQEAKVGSDVKLSLGDAPDDITLDADKGLLELNTGARHSIYVDEQFVGRGPRRRVPLGTGKHDVRLKLNGEELKQVVEIEARRTTLFEVQGTKDED